MTDSLARMLEGPDAEIDRLCAEIRELRAKNDRLLGLVGQLEAYKAATIEEATGGR